jgi:hypothetical protein
VTGRFGNVTADFGERDRKVGDGHRSNGRLCQVSAMTSSVTELMKSTETWVP